VAIGTPVSLGSTAFTTGASTTAAQLMSGNAPAASRIFMLIGQFGAAAIAATPATGGSLTWVKDFDGVNASDNVRWSMISADCPAGLSATTLTGQWATNADARTISLFYATGVATGASGYLSGTPGQAHALGGTTFTTPNVTPVAGETLIFGGSALDGVGASANGAFTSGTELADFGNATTTEGQLVGYRIVTADGVTVYTLAGTFSPAPGEQEYITVAYKASAAATSAAAPPRRFPLGL
jgi:hypothetical protein